MKTEPAWARFAVIAIGLSYVLAGGALLFAPLWFFENIGPFPPFNRHYAGDAGAFNLPYGLGLLWAARSIRKRISMIVIAAIASVLHVLNHANDHLAEGATLTHWLPDAAPLALAAMLLAAIAVQARSSGKGPSRGDSAQTTAAN